MARMDVQYEDALYEPWARRVFPDPENWRWARLPGGVTIFYRGLACHEAVGRELAICHGTPLSTAYTILREGIKVGDATHGQRQGWFCMHEGPQLDRIRDARDRSVTARCEQFQLSLWVSGWSVPVVLGFVPWADVEVTHLEQFTDGCWKSCIQEKPGVSRPLPHQCWLAFYYNDQIRYSRLQALEPSRAEWMICGGRSYFSDKHNRTMYDTLYWTDEGNNMPPSCGNYVAIKDLHTDNSRGWVRNPTSKIWYCPACDAVHKSWG